MTQLSPLLATRWSPHAFDPVAELADPELASLLEAARWAPSAGNGQPWRFAVGWRDDETHKRILTNLSPADQRWAGRASALILAGYVVTPDPGAAGTDSGQAGSPAAVQAGYDLGQAVAHLTVQASTLELYVHQLVAFDADQIRIDLDLPAGTRPQVVLAVGRLGDPLSLPPDLRDRELGLRHRRPLAELLLS